MRNFGASLLLVLTVFVSTFAATQAQQPNEYPAKSSVMGGPGLDDLTIRGVPDEHGLVLDIREPERHFESWMVTVFNTNSRPVFDVYVTLEIQVEGEWYLANMQASKNLVIPGRIGAGEFGFAKMGGILAAPPEWEDSRIVVDSVSDMVSFTTVSLSLPKMNIDGQSGYTGSFLNSTSTAVTDIALIVGCVESGRLVDEFYYPFDLLKLEPGDSDQFSFSGKNGTCSSPNDTIVTAVATPRESN